MNDPTDTTPVADSPGQRLVRTMALDCAAAAGHFDELRGVTAIALANSLLATNLIADDGHLTGAWSQFFEHLTDHGAPDLNQRTAAVEQQIRDNGVTYNVYADEGGPQRPWSLSLFPLVIEPDSWQQIEAGILQRMRLLEGIMADVYGPQQLLAKGLLPPALVHGHPGYLRAMHGVQPAGGTHLHVAAFDLARGPDGNWWTVSQRCQAPSGLGYLLENRLAISGQFPQAFKALHVQSLVSTYLALVDSLKHHSPAGADAHLALLTPGPYNETYFEHAYLARFLGLTLVEGSDLMVRDERLYLKTLKGLVPVHGLLKRVDDQYLDPLELRPDSTLGVPGLLQAIRAGNVLVANAPGSAILESPALLGFLPALSQHLLGQALQLPAPPTWWCGERAAMDQALPQLQDYVIKPTYPGSPLHASFDAVRGGSLSPRERDEWAARIVLQGEAHTLQAYMPLSQIPTWQSSEQGAGASHTQGSKGRLAPRSVMLRVFAVSHGPQSWRVLPGGLARVAGATEELASMQHGGSSADVWALSHGTVDKFSWLPPHIAPAPLAERKRLVTSRAAENLFWLGRYTERTENAIRLAQLTLECLNREAQTSPALLAWLSTMAVANTLVLPGTPSAAQASRAFEHALISSLGSTDGATSVGYNLRALKMAASTVREPLSQDHWRTIVRAEEYLFASCTEHARSGEHSVFEALRILKATSDDMATITRAQTYGMAQDDGWRLLSIGRHIERLWFLASSLARGIQTGSVYTEGGVAAMGSLFERTVTVDAPSGQSRDLAAALDGLVQDRDNPRTLAWVAHALRGQLDQLTGSERDQRSDLSLRVPDPSAWRLAQFSESATPHAAHTATDAESHIEPRFYLALNDLLQQCISSAFNVSDQISATYFIHSTESKQSVGTS